MESQVKITNGYGIEIPEEMLVQMMDELLDFDTAAQEIDLFWSRHHIHKEIKQKRVMKSHLVIIHDESLYHRVGYGKKFYITKTEVARIKAYVKARPKRKLERCEWCDRQIRYCKSKPCGERLKASPTFKYTLERVSAVADEFINRANKRGRQFNELNKAGERKNLTGRPRPDVESDNGEAV